MADPLWINASAGAPAYSANELRQAMGLALMYDGRNMGGRKGVRPGGTQLAVSYAAPTITVQPGLCCLDPALSTPQGSYWVAIPAAETHTLTAADATNPRKDIVIARLYDHDEDASGLRLARSEYIAGVANPAPSEPAVPAGAIRLATIDVPASPGAPVVTNNAPFTVSPGGILPVRGAADIAAALKGRYRDRLDTNVLERDTGAAWETAADPAAFKAWPSYTPAWTSGGTAPVLGLGSIAGSYMQVGKTVTARGGLVMGSTTTFGTGSYRVSVPVAASAASQSQNVGTLWLFQNGVQTRIGTCTFVNSTTLWLVTAAGDITNVSPHTWANGDQLRWQITYEAA